MYDFMYVTRVAKSIRFIPVTGKIWVEFSHNLERPTVLSLPVEIAQSWVYTLLRDTGWQANVLFGHETIVEFCRA